MIYGYARVSTKLQATDGNSIEAQVQQLQQSGATLVFRDTFTGTKKHRPALDELLTQLNPGDTVIVTKLDRIARSTEDGLELIQSLIDKDISVNVLNMGVINNTPTGKLILTVMLAFAEFERNMILERTQEGRAIARQQPNYKEGRKKKYTPERISAALEMLNTYSYKQVEVRTGISKSTLIRAKREQNYQNAHNII
jgi:DNA invertase Pin-like site-specific DNA recombinase